MIYALMVEYPSMYASTIDAKVRKAVGRPKNEAGSGFTFGTGLRDISWEWLSEKPALAALAARSVRVYHGVQGLVVKGETSLA